MILNRVLTFSLLLVSSLGFSQQTLTAKESVFIALENNYQMQIAQKQHDINSMNNDWMGAGAFPTVSLQVNQNNAVQDNSNNPLTFTPGLVLQQSLSPALVANWNIFSGFNVFISKQRLEQLENQSANNITAVIETTVQDVLKAYYTAQLQNERTALYDSILSLSREKYQYYTIKEKYSTSNSLESMQFKNQYFTDSINFILQSISTENAMRNLKLLMNDTTETAYLLVDQLEIDMNAIDFEASKEEMLSNNANLKNQYINLEQQKLNTSLQRSFLYPTLSLQAGVNPNWNNIRDVETSTVLFNTNSITYYGNLSLRYTLFNNWQNKRAVEVSKIQEEINQLTISEMEQTLVNTLANLVDLYQARVQLVAISTQNLEYAEGAFELAKKRYENGTINSIDLTTIQNTYQNTLLQHYENLYNKLDTYLEIYRLTGKIGLEYQNN